MNRYLFVALFYVLLPIDMSLNAAESTYQSLDNNIPFFFLFKPGMDYQDAVHAKNLLTVNRNWLFHPYTNSSDMQFTTIDAEWLDEAKSYPVHHVRLHMGYQHKVRFVREISITSSEYPNPNTDKRLHQWLSAAISMITEKVGRKPDKLDKGEYRLPTTVGSYQHAFWDFDLYHVRINESLADEKNDLYSITIWITSKRKIPWPSSTFTPNSLPSKKPAF